MIDLRYVYGESHKGKLTRSLGLNRPLIANDDADIGEMDGVALGVSDYHKKATGRRYYSKSHPGDMPPEQRAILSREGPRGVKPGMVFGLLTSYDLTRQAPGGVEVLCVCECGKEKWARRQYLLSGAIRTCGSPGCKGKERTRDKS